VAVPAAMTHRPAVAARADRPRVAVPPAMAVMSRVVAVAPPRAEVPAVVAEPDSRTSPVVPAGDCRAPTA
jgi:hypothetical protein